MNRIHPEISAELRNKILQDPWFRDAARQYCDDITDIFTAFLRSLPDPELPQHASKKKTRGTRRPGDRLDEDF